MSALSQTQIAQFEGILLMSYTADSTPHPTIPQSLHFVTYLPLLKQVFEERPTIKQVSLTVQCLQQCFFSTPTNVSVLLH
jgi:hypothetical protein